MASVILVALAAAAHAEDRELALLRGLMRDEGGASGDWSKLPHARQVELLLRGLRCDDADIAYLAARALDAGCLSLDEVRLQARILVSRPEWIRDRDAARPPWARPGRLPLGAEDLAGLWKAACSVEDLPGAQEQLLYYHRAALPEHIPMLVEHLDRAGPEVFHALVGTLQLVAGYTDEHRAVAARGFLYALERVRRERAGRPAPRMGQIEDDPTSKAAFLKLARARWLGPDGFAVEGAPSLGAPHGWILRWAREVPLSKADIPFLTDIVSRAEESEDPEDMPEAPWAIRCLGELGAREQLADLADGDGAVAVWASAELARRGAPARFHEMLGESDDWSLPRTMAWHADPVEARRRRLAQILLDPGLGDIEPLARYDAEAEYGLRIREEDLAWIGANLVAIDAQPERVAAYFAQVYPDGMTAEVAADVGRRLRDSPADPDGLAGMLARIEVVDRDALVRLLDHWGARGRREALHALARLGEARHVPAMLASWADGDFEAEEWVLGRVRSPEVEERLRAGAESGDASAVKALAILYGLPEPLREFLEDPSEAQRALVLERDPVGAVLHALREDLSEVYPSWIARTGLARDGRVVALLREIRGKRHLGLYWAATAGLALGGDEEARRELGAVMREARTWLLDDILDGEVLTMGGQKEWVDLWVSRVNTNCCLSYDAISILTEVFPTIPLVHDRILDFGRKDRFARAWIDRHGFARSRLLDGLLPVAKGG